jgi:hypothetical protein
MNSVHFRQKGFENWDRVVDYYLKKEKIITGTSKNAKKANRVT